MTMVFLAVLLTDIEHSHKLILNWGSVSFGSLFGLILYIPVNIFSVMSGQVFLG